MKKAIAPSILIILFFSCSILNVTTMKPKNYAFIKNGDREGQALIKIDDYGLEDMSINVFIFYDKICVADNVLKRIQIMDPSGEVELVIGSLANITSNKVNKKNFNFSSIGSVFMDNDGNLYIQNKISQAAKDKKMEFAPSYILVFNKKGDLQYTLGQNGTPDLPFYYIENIDVDNDGRLIVVSRNFDIWNIFGFRDKKRIFHINLGKLNLLEKEGDDEFNGKIENVKMYTSGNKMIVSAAYYNGLRFKYRKVYDYSIKDDKIEKEILTIPDPKNILFNIIDDKHIYFWNMEKEVRFVIYNLDGKIINNIKLDAGNGMSYYTRIMGDRKGNLYSFNVSKNGVQVFEWE